MAQSSNFSAFSQSVIDDQYEIVCPVGRGRHSVVYKAIKIDPERIRSERITVALKILVGHVRDPEVHRRRMKREALAMLSSVHRNVIKLLDYNSKGDLCYLAMEFAEGGDLRQMLEAHQLVLTPDLSLRLMLQVLTALERIHHVGIIHRDIKPENILLNNEGLVKLADFGISLLPGEKEPPEEVHRGVGTFDYLAPECLEEGAASRATDVYSAAVTCYQLLTGNLPFGGSSFTEQITNKMESRILPLKNFIKDEPPLLQEFMEHALSSDPEVRFNSATEFKEAIEQYLGGTWEPRRARLSRSQAAQNQGAPGSQPESLDWPEQDIVEPAGEPDFEEPVVSAAAEAELGTKNRQETILRIIQKPKKTGISSSKEFVVKERAAKEVVAPVRPAIRESARAAEQTVPKRRRQRTLTATKTLPPSVRQRALFSPFKLSLGAAAIGIVLFGLWFARHAHKPSSVLSGFFPGSRYGSESSSLNGMSQAVSPETSEGLSTALSGSVELAASTSPAPAILPVQTPCVAELPENGFISLFRRESTGLLSNLLADGSSVSLATVPIYGGKEVLVYLAISGWEPVVLSSEVLSSGNEVRLYGGGMQLALKLEQPASSGFFSSKSNELKGTYKDYSSGREGEWAIW